MRRWLSRALVVAAVCVIAPPPAISVRAQAPAIASTFCGTRPITAPTPDAQLESYRPSNPRRLVDTRDGTGGVAAPVPVGCSIELALGAGVTPPDTEAAALSITVLSPVRGFLSAYPCASGRPETSSMNSRAGVPTPNLVVSLLDSSDRVCIFSSHGADLVIDLAGTWGPGPDRFNSIEPVRAYDSRLTGGQLAPATTRNVPIAGQHVPANATAVVINLTATAALTPGWLVAFPCGSPPPLASNLNVLAGEDRAVAAIVGLGPSGAGQGQICVRSHMSTHFVVDVIGYYAPTPAFGPAATIQAIDGRRLVDSRDGTGGWSTPLAAGETRSFDPLAGATEAERASAVMLNVVATEGAGVGHLRVFPCGGTIAETSSVNFEPEVEATNLVISDVGADGRVCVRAHTSVHVVIDLYGVAVAPQGSLVEQLSVRGKTVYPSFQPGAADYAIECSAGTNDLIVHLDLLPRATATIGGQPAGTGDITVAVASEALLPIELRRDTQVDTYYFRCLPADFPRPTISSSGTPAPGWYLTAFGPTPGFFNVILDERGAPVWYKRTSEALVNLQLTEDGNLVSTNQGLYFGTDEDDLVHWTHDLTGALVVTQGTDDVDAYPVDHHEFLAGPEPDGGWTIVSYPFRAPVDTSGMVGGGPGDSVVDGAIREFDAAGNVVWEWNSADYFAPAETTFPQRFGRYPSPMGGEVDALHINSIERLDDGDYLVSARHLDAVFRVNHDPGGPRDGDVLWILGSLPSNPLSPGYIANPDPATKRLQILDDPWGGPRRQHDARMDGNLLTIYDNRTGMTGQTARVSVYQIDEVAGTARLVREIRHPGGGISPALGSARLAADGSMLVNWGQLEPRFQEFDASNQLLLSMRWDSAGNTYRITKVPVASFDIAELRATSGGSLDLGPP